MVPRSALVIRLEFRCRRRRASRSVPLAQRALAVGIEEVGLGGVDRQRNLLAQIAHWHPLLERCHEILRLILLRADVDGTAGRGRLDHSDNAVEGVVRRYLEW